MSTQLVLTGMEIKEIKEHFENLSYGNTLFIWIAWGIILVTKTKIKHIYFLDF